MAIKVLESEGQLDPEQLDFFLRGNLSLEKAARKNPHPWFPESGWQDAMRLITLAGGGAAAAGTGSALATVADSIERDEAEWRAYYELEAPEAAPLPGGLSERLTAFEQLLVLRCVRMDRITVRALSTTFVSCCPGSTLAQKRRARPPGDKQLR
jgi:dynein heavy chain, axonemal